MLKIGRRQKRLAKMLSSFTAYSFTTLKSARLISSPSIESEKSLLDLRSEVLQQVAASERAFIL
jgi:hypothetical protein